MFLDFDLRWILHSTFRDFIDNDSKIFIVKETVQIFLEEGPS
jgi:hypothetical protein